MEKKVSYENIKSIGKMTKDGSISDFSSRVSAAEKKASDILKKLNELEERQRAAKRAEAERLAAEEAAQKAASLNAEKAGTAETAVEAPKAEKAETADKAEAAEKSRTAQKTQSPESKAATPKAQTPEKPVKAEKAEQPATPEKAAKADKTDKTQKPETAVKTEKAQTAEKVLKAEKAEKAEKSEKAEKAEKAESGEAAPKAEAPKAEKAAKAEAAPKTERAEKPAKGEKPQQPAAEKNSAQTAADKKAAPAADRRAQPADRNSAQQPDRRNISQGDRRPASQNDRRQNPSRQQAGDRQQQNGQRRTYDNNPQGGARRQAGAAQMGGGANKTFINRDPRDSRPPRAGQSAAPRTGQQRAGQPRTGTSATQQRPRTILKVTPSAIPATTAKKSFGADKKKGFDKTYIEKEKRTYSKRALQKQQGASIEDFDENKSGYRKLRLKKDKRQKSSQTIVIEHAVVTTNDIPLKTLSEKLGISAVEITKRLFKNGIMKTVNESIDYDTAAYIASELGIELEYKPEKTAEEVLFEKQADTVEEIESLVPRPPVVTVMGHVDHGKTSLLDYIRKAHIAAGEAGGITQHIGAYTVDVGGKGITFIDTPGHEAFTAMRARGAQVTDIVILVVAADDGVMPQTVEAINHAKAAGVDIIVAINKIDKMGADPEKVKRELTNYDLLAEEWGGKIPMCPISCKTGEGIDTLLETVILTAEMKELLANPAREARGTVIEAQLDKGKGPVATVLIQNGTLHTGDNLISGTVAGKVRAMIDDRGKIVKEAGPSMAVNVLGLDSVPESGDSIFAVSQELMKQVMDERKRKESIARVNATPGKDIDALFGSLADGEKKTLNLIIKCDVQGSVEAIRQSVLKLENDEVNIKVIHGAAGAINESDIMLAESAKALVIGFNVRPDSKAKTLAERSKVEVRQYRVIYDLLDDIESISKGMRAPQYQEIMLGKCEVRQTFKITGVGNIAGCYVLDGKIVRGGKLRIYRDNILVVEGGVKQLKRFKDDVKEVAQGFECGCAIEGFNDIKVGDIIECYLIEEVARK